jgi:hypothetical protein
MTRFCPLACGVLLGLAVAAPAGAVTGGFGASAALHQGKVLTISVAAVGRPQHSCQENRAGGRVGRKFAPVACEQPPRSTPLPPDALAKAVAGALAAIG